MPSSSIVVGCGDEISRATASIQQRLHAHSAAEAGSRRLSDTVSTGPPSLQRCSSAQARLLINTAQLSAAASHACTHTVQQPCFSDGSSMYAGRQQPPPSDSAAERCCGYRSLHRRGPAYSRFTGTSARRVGASGTRSPTDTRRVRPSQCREPFVLGSPTADV